MISYESPQVFGVSGCHNIENTTNNCQNYGQEGWQGCMTCQLMFYQDYYFV